MKFLPAGTEVVVRTKLGTSVRGMLLEPVLGLCPIVIVKRRVDGSDGSGEDVVIEYGALSVASVERAPSRFSF